MTVREYFNSIRDKKKKTNNQLRQLMDEQPFEKMDTPDNIKVTKLVKWCMEHLGYHNFVICQNVIYFEDTASMIHFKLLCPVDDMRRRF